MSPDTLTPTAERDAHRFQVDLGGLIELLSRHLYASPAVFLRELLQNAVDATAARSAIQPAHRPAIRVELGVDVATHRPTLAFVDNGVGLTTVEVHALLATIGASSKRRLAGEPCDFIGRFGIGLLSCFLVSDEIVVVTRSATPGAEPVCWRGRADGTYAVEPAPADTPVGSCVRLVARAGCESYFERDEVLQTLRGYGELLDVSLTLTDTDGFTSHVDHRDSPWSGSMSTADRIRWAEARLGAAFVDAIELDGGGARAVAYVLDHETHPGAHAAHRVYVKGMLVCEAAAELLPDWAFFVRCVIEGPALRPTASREALYRDDVFDDVRDALGRQLKQALVTMVEREPARFVQIMQRHAAALAELAVHDAECYAFFMPRLPFSTTLGPTVFDALEPGTVVRYMNSGEQLRQIEATARARGLRIVHASWHAAQRLLERLPELYPGVRVERMTVADVVHELDGLSSEEDVVMRTFLARARDALAVFECTANCRRFEPVDLPVILTRNESAAVSQAARVEQTRAGSAWQGVLARLATRREDAFAELCFNADNALVQRLTMVDDSSLHQTVALVMYVQALLLGHHPVGDDELAVLTGGLGELVERAMRAGDVMH